MEDEFPCALMNVEKLNDYASSIVQILATKELRSDDARKISTLELLRYFVRPPTINLPFEISATDFLDAILAAGKFNYKQLAVKGEKYLLSFTAAFLELDVNFDIKNDVLKFVIDTFTSENSSEGCEFLLQLWRKRSSLRLSTQNSEKIALNLPVCVEEVLIKMCQDMLGFEEATSAVSESLFEEKQLFSLIDLCSRSQSVFKVSTVILHELCILSKAHSNILFIISEFMRAILQRNKAGIIELFPPDHRLLAIMMNIDPDLYPEENTDINFSKAAVVLEIQRKIASDKQTMAMLFSYFPKWLYVYVKLYEKVNAVTVRDKICWLHLLDFV